LQQVLSDNVLNNKCGINQQRFMRGVLLNQKTFSSSGGGLWTSESSRRNSFLL